MVGNAHERREQILRLIIRAYLASGNPVSSRAICSQYPLGLCSASIRNVMADLEEMGYITHLHTSAGRIPTDAGYRFYVDRLLEEQHLTAEEQLALNRELVSKQLVFEDVMRNTSRILSEFTQCAAIISAPEIARCCFRHIQFVWLDQKRICVTLVTNTGYTKSQLVNLDHGIQKDALERIQNFLNEHLADVALSQIRAVLRRMMIQERNSFFYLMQEAVDLLDVSSLVQDQAQFYFEGLSNILGMVEFENTEAVRMLLRTVEDKQRLMELLRRAQEQEGGADPATIRVLIGNENPYTELQNCTTVVGSYYVDEQPAGMLAIVGPKRMNYGRAIAAVAYVRDALSDVVAKFRV